MVWPLVAAMAISAVSSAGKNAAASGQVNAANIIGEAEAAAANLMRGANNELATKRTTLARYTQSVNAQRVMKATGSNMEAALINYNRRRDARLTDTLEQQVGEAEQAGAALAAGGASGLVGGVADVVASTAALRRERIAAKREATMDFEAYDARKQQTAILRQGLQSVDTSDISANIDYGQSLYTKKEHQDSFFMDVAQAGVSAYMKGGMGSGASSAGNPSWMDKMQTAFKYDTKIGSQQTSTLSEQDSWFK